MIMLASGRKMELQAESAPSGRYRSVVDERTELDSTLAARMLPLIESAGDSVLLDLGQMRVGMVVKFKLAGQPMMAVKKATGEIDFYVIGV